MSKRNLIPWLALAAMMPAVTLAETGKLTATVQTTPLKWRPVKNGKERAEQSFTFVTGKQAYTVRYAVLKDPKQPGKVLTGEGYLGMPQPTSCNWYHSGFLFVRVNGKDLGGTPLYRAYVSETGDRAMADVVWDAPQARARVRFAAKPGDDKLLCEVALEPKEKVSRIDLTIRCYPSFFTAWFKRDGDRKVLTPATTFNQGQTTGGPVKDHWFAVYYDTIFDVARGEGYGPCAAMFDPASIRNVRFSVGSYGVTTELSCDPAARTFRLAFWEFPKKPNAEVLAAFKASGESWLKELQSFDFTPAAVKSFDAAAELKKLEELSRPAPVRKELGAQADQFHKRIEALLAAKTGPGVIQQADLLGLLAEYRQFLWKLKLAALLAE